MKGHETKTKSWFSTRFWNNLQCVYSKSKGWKAKSVSSFSGAIKPKGLNRIVKIG